MCKHWKSFLFIVGLTLAAAALSGFLTRGMEGYSLLVKPPLSPPGIVFPIVWTILYALMGIAAWIIYLSDSPQKYPALKLYVIQLAVNLIWPFLFFNLGNYLLAFIWLLLLIALVFFMIRDFYAISKTAGFLLSGYLLWLLFAGYLNLGIYLLNR